MHDALPTLPQAQQSSTRGSILQKIINDRSWTAWSEAQQPQVFLFSKLITIQRQCSVCWRVSRIVLPWTPIPFESEKRI